jgi:hypothetical protein
MYRISKLWFVQDCITRDEACLARQGVQEEQLGEARSALARCLSAALQADPAIAEGLGSATGILMTVAAARLLWYRAYGLQGPIFPLDR